MGYAIDAFDQASYRAVDLISSRSMALLLHSPVLGRRHAHPRADGGAKGVRVTIIKAFGNVLDGKACPAKQVQPDLPPAVVAEFIERGACIPEAAAKGYPAKSKQVAKPVERGQALFFPEHLQHRPSCALGVVLRTVLFTGLEN